MRKKLFHVACFLCVATLASPAVFGEEPTWEELWAIAKEACAKNLWKPEFSDPNKPVGQRPFAHPERDMRAWDYLSRDVLYYSKVANTSKIFQQQLSKFKNLLVKCKESVLPEWNTEEWDFGTEAIIHDTVKHVRESEYIRKTFAASNPKTLMPFFMEKMQPFTDKRDLEFLKAIDAFAKELRVFYNFLQSIQSEVAKTEIPPEIPEKLSKAFAERKSALLQAFRAPMYDKNSLATYYRDDFWDAVNACAFLKKFDVLCRNTAFARFRPKDFKIAEEKAKDNFGILGLDMDRVKYPDPFKDQKRREQVGKFLQEQVDYFKRELYAACKRIGGTAEKNFIDALNLLYPLTEKVWTCERFEPETVMQTFKEALLKCDIEVLISDNKPKPDNNELRTGFEMLRKEKGIDTGAVEKSIYDAYIDCFEDNVRKCFYAEASALLELTNHRISFIKTVRKMEETDYEATETAHKNVAKQVTEWRLKQEEYVKKLRIADVDFYNTFFDRKMEDSNGKYILTPVGAVKQPKCLDILEDRLKDYGLWEPIIWKKKEDPKDPNIKGQNTGVEDKKESETAKKEIIPQEYTRLTNERELPTRTRRGQNNG